MNPYLGEIRVTGFNFAPVGWHLCDGTLLPIAQNQALFSVLGTFYGGDGRTNFALPNLQGRMAMHSDFNLHPVGQSGGENTHTLTAAELPAHVHAAFASADLATAGTATGNLLASRTRGGPVIYGPAAGLVALEAGATSAAGGNAGHNNQQPSLGLNFIIALAGIFPSRA